MPLSPTSSNRACRSDYWTPTGPFAVISTHSRGHLKLHEQPGTAGTLVRERCVQLNAGHSVRQITFSHALTLDAVEFMAVAKQLSPFCWTWSVSKRKRPFVD